MKRDEVKLKGEWRVSSGIPSCICLCSLRRGEVGEEKADWTRLNTLRIAPRHGPRNGPSNGPSNY